MKPFQIAKVFLHKLECTVVLRLHLAFGVCFWEMWESSLHLTVPESPRKGKQAGGTQICVSCVRAEVLTKSCLQVYRPCHRFQRDNLCTDALQLFSLLLTKQGLNTSFLFKGKAVHWADKERDFYSKSKPTLGY